VVEVLVSPTFGKPSYIEIGGIDLTDAVAEVDLGDDAWWVNALPGADATMTLSGFWDPPALEFTVDFCTLTPASRCFWLKTFYPKRYERLRRMRYETRRRRKRRGH
jgi:hypothetical protein